MRRREKNEYLHKLLIEWGEWVEKTVVLLGYSSRTQISVMMEYGEMCRSGNRAVAVVPVYFPNRRCAKISVIVDGLPQKQKKALEAVYVRNLKESELVKEGHKLRTHYRRLNEAFKYISGKLGITYEA